MRRLQLLWLLSWSACTVGEDVEPEPLEEPEGPGDTDPTPRDTDPPPRDTDPAAQDSDATSDDTDAGPVETDVPRDTGLAGGLAVPLFDAQTPLDPPLQEDTPTALITRLADRARDRHAREDEFGAYDHYLALYWEHRTVEIQITDTVGRGGSSITFDVTTQWPLSPTQAELRFFYRGLNTVAEYHNNGVMNLVGPNLYTRSVSVNGATQQPLQVGDRMEFELSQFLQAPPRGRSNYYGTTFLYVVGEGIVPWEPRGVFGDASTEREDSYPIDEAAWLGGGTTLHAATSGEPRRHFQQMATLIAPQHGQPFVLGRRVHHTDAGTGTHDESAENPVFTDLVGTLGPSYVARSCVACHVLNGRALPPETGQPLDGYVVRVGDATGAPDPALGAVLQPNNTLGSPEGTVVLDGWDAVGDLRRPRLAFSGVEPAAYSARAAPALVGMGLLEAVPESTLEALADPSDADGDGISGRVRRVVDPITQVPRVGRFGWKGAAFSVEHQVASAFQTDMGVLTTWYPAPDCGDAQGDCGGSGPELADQHLRDLTTYVSLLGVRPRRDLDDVDVIAGEALFDQVGCAACHVPQLQTSPYAPKAELRDQTIAPYTDLLLHDMGPELASSLPEGNATGAEWRTAPLWSIGLTQDVSGGEAYLHDGRARSLEEAIAWHGGEGTASRSAFDALSASEQASLIAFLRSL